MQNLERKISYKTNDPKSLGVDTAPGPAAKYFNTPTAANYLGLSRQYLEIKRHTGDAPPYVKLARAVRYRKSDLDGWMASQLRQHTAEPSNAGDK